MPTRPGKALRQWLVAVVVAALAFLVLARFTSLDALAGAWARFDLSLFVVAAALFFLNIAARAWRLRALTADGGNAPALDWLRLAAMHQVIFALLPSGSGDFGYPLLAARLVGTKTATALRTLLIYRFQDLMALLGIAGGGLCLFAGQRAVTPAVAIIVVVAGAGLLAAPDVARLGMKLLGRALAAMTFKNRIIAQWRSRALDYVGLLEGRGSLAIRIHTAISCLVSWCAAMASLWTLFAMTGIRLDMAEIMLVIAGLNLVGALATFTIAGLGVSEGGLAVLLAFLGHAADSAAIALTVRPLALINSLVVCGVVEVVVRFRRRATRPTAGTTQVRER